MADWFYGKEGTQHGPVSDQEIGTFISSGQIDGSTIIWREGMADWLPLSQVPEFQVTPGTNPGTPYNTPQSYAGPQPYGQTIPTDTLSIASLVCGVLAILASCMYIGFIFGIPAAICGHMSLKKIKNSPTPIQGKGLAIAGLITGYLGIFISLSMIILVLGVFGLAAFESQQAL